MYADDTNISFSGPNLNDLQQRMNVQLNKLNCWLRANKLSLNVAKTEFMIIGSRQRLLTQNNDDIHVYIDDKEINRVKHTKSLGLIIDGTLSWSEHINDLSKKISSGIGALKRIRQFIGHDTALKIYKVLIEPHFNYCNSLWGGLSKQLADKLQKVQNRAARVITNSNYETKSASIFSMLNWDNLFNNRKKHKAILMYKTINKLMLDYLQELFYLRVNNYNLRDSDHKLELPKPRTDYLKRSISYSGALLWNNLPNDLRSLKFLNIFKVGVDKFFSGPDYSTVIM